MVAKNIFFNHVINILQAIYTNKNYLYIYFISTHRNLKPRHYNFIQPNIDKVRAGIVYAEDIKF